VRHALPAAAAVPRRAQRRRAEVAAHVQTFAQRLGSYPDWPEIDDIDACVACPVPESDRPADDDIGKVAGTAFHSAMARGLAAVSDTPANKAA
jgi:glutathione-regulated potassium-efflux system ancillary protein KefF